MICMCIYVKQIFSQLIYACNSLEMLLMNIKKVDKFLVGYMILVDHETTILVVIIFL